MGSRLGCVRDVEERKNALTQDIIAHGKKHDRDIRRICKSEKAVEPQQRSILLLMDQLLDLDHGEMQGRFLGFGSRVANAIGAQEVKGRFGEESCVS